MEIPAEKACNALIAVVGTGGVSTVLYYLVQPIQKELKKAQQEIDNAIQANYSYEYIQSLKDSLEKKVNEFKAMTAYVATLAGLTGIALAYKLTK